MLHVLNLFCSWEGLNTDARIGHRELNEFRNSIAPIASLRQEIYAMVFKAGMRLEAGTGLHFAVLVSHVILSEEEPYSEIVRDHGRFPSQVQVIAYRLPSARR